MSYEFDAPEEYGGESPFLKQPGTYHFQVLNPEDGVSQEGKPIDGFSCSLVVVSDGDQEGKKINLTLFNPRESDKETAQRVGREKIANFFIACNLLDPNASKGKRVSVNLGDAQMQQIVATFVPDDRNPKYLQLDYAAIFHVDDPEVEKVQKSLKHLAILPPECRREKSWFEFKAKAKKKQTPSPVGAGASDDKWSDL